MHTSKKNYIACILSMCFWIVGYSQNDFSLISYRIKEQICKESTEQNILKSVVTHLPSLQKDGSWADIDYSNKDITKWKPGTHLSRVQDLTKALISEEGFYNNNVTVWNSIISALRFWYEQNPKSNNWWHNEIATPQSLGEILILLQYSNMQVPRGLQDSLIQRMKQGDVFEKTGANKLDIALHMIYRACVSKDKLLMDTAVQQAFQPIAFTTMEGIQYDYSYLQHGPQLQISSYGLVFLNGEYKVASWMKGTAYELSGEQLKILNHYFLNTFLPAIRGRYIDFNTEGRGISRKDVLDKIGLAANAKNNSLLEAAKIISPENAEIIDASIERISEKKQANFSIKAMHNFFWKADYTQHLRSEYTFNVRMVSKRTKRTESGNKENLLGKYLADGSTNIQRSGKEYYNIMPIWEWDKIPGITARDFNLDQQTKIQWGEDGSTQFVGGLTDGLYGISCYDMDYDSVSARKSWFFFDKEVVCLGAGINSNALENITTTINQCWLEGKAKVFTNGSVTTVKKDNTTKTANWVWHDSIGYFFLEPSNVCITTQEQKGSWNKINASQSKEDIQGDVFKLWLNHGVKPLDSSYAYCVVPGIGLNEMSNNNISKVKIVANNSKSQIIYHKSLDMLQAVFYNAGEIYFENIYINVSEPCVLMVKQTQSKNPEIYIADPTQKLEKIKIKIQFAEIEKKQEIMCVLPKGNQSGASINVRY